MSEKSKGNEASPQPSRDEEKHEEEEESGFLSFLDNLSPMKSDKRVRFKQRLSMSSFPISQPVFDSSPTCDEVCGSGGDQSKGEGGVDVHEARIACVDQYLADLLPSGALANESMKPVSGIDCQQYEQGQHQQDIHQYLQFETAKASKYSSDVTRDMADFVLPPAVGASRVLLASGLSVSRDTLIPCPSHLAVDILQHPSALQVTQLNIQLAPSQSPRPSQILGAVAALNQMTPERIRKRSRNNNETSGCKHCNCKKTKCLKLYCECFSAGIYCDEGCSCEKCLNKPEYEDTVNDFRKQIELRNPHAFAARCVGQVTGSPANTMEEFNQITPSSARHKRGCNCKKSKCVKKYCECYQQYIFITSRSPALLCSHDLDELHLRGRVELAALLVARMAYAGCSEGCRCENCENPYSTKAEVIHLRTVNQENQYPEQHDVLKTQHQYARIGRNQSSPMWEPLSDISNMAPLSHPSLAGHESMQFASARFTPNFDSSLPVENFPNILYNVVYSAPVLDHTFTPRKTSNAGSSNKINASPVQVSRSGIQTQFAEHTFVPSSFALDE